MQTTLAFDIETIPDVPSIRLLYDLPQHLSDADVAEYAMQQRRARNGSDFMQHHLHRVVAISCCMRWDSQKIYIASIGDVGDDEGSLIAQFFNLIERYTPQLVSWNGGGFDLPVLHYRALVHGIAAPRYWDMGDGDFGDSRDFKWNNYISRYHMRHCDLMDLLSLYQARAAVPLDDMAKICGFPGKLGMDGSKVWEAFQQGEIEAIRHYCETDAANTYLMYLRFCLMKGSLDADEYDQEIRLMKQYLSTKSSMPHWEEFLAQWK